MTQRDIEELSHFKKCFKVETQADVCQVTANWWKLNECGLVQRQMLCGMWQISVATRLYTSRHQEHLAGHRIVQAEGKPEKEKKSPYEQSMCVSVCVCSSVCLWMPALELVCLLELSLFC